MTPRRPGTAVMTGATGFIGWRLAEWLRDEGWQVRALVRPESRRAVPNGVERVAGPMVIDSLRRACERADVVFHVAGRTAAPSRRMFDRVNVDVTRALAVAGRDAGARFVSVSSQAAAGPATAQHPRTELDQPDPCSAYGASKLAGEAAIKEVEGLAWTIVRPVAVYGPRDRGFYPLFRMARAGFLPMTGDPSAPYQFIHVDELVRVIARAAVVDTALHGVFFVGHPAVHRIDHVLACVANAAGRTVRTLRVPRPLMVLAALWGDAASMFGATLVFDRSKLRDVSAGGFVCSVAHAADVLGQTPTIDIPEGFASTAAWYRRQGWL